MLRRILDERRAVILGALAALPLLVTGVGTAHAADHAAGAAPSRHRFEHPTDIDNRFFPVVPGTEFVYDGKIVDADGVHPHRIVFIATDLVKVIDGVRTVVAWDRDFEDGELSESELAFFAQDRHRNVWTLGEYPEEYQDGRLTGAPDTWISGVARSRGGILLPGRPRVGTPPFVQGRAPAIEFFDVGKVINTNARVCVPVGCFRHVVIVDEWSPLAPEDGHQIKYYAPGVGLVKIGARGGDSREFVTLSAIHHLGGKALARARAAALAMDRRGYRISAVYRHTPHAFRPCHDR